MAGKVVQVIQATVPIVSAQSHSAIRKRRVAGYARVSTEKEEQQNSYEAQLDYYTTYIQSNPEWIFVDVYSDEGITGTSIKKRDGFNQMIADALDGKIDLIITKSVSRFARNTVDSLTTVRKLKEKGVEVYFQKENIYTLDSKGELLITIMSSLAQEESRSISENTTWGQRKRFADGKMSLAYSNFLGYKKGSEAGEMEIVEEEAVIVRRIYDEYLSGKTPYDIAARLTEEQIPTPSKKTQWRVSTIVSILHNEKYRGDAILQKEYTVDFLSKTTKKNEGELPMYYIPQNHPAIIRPEVFEMVQEEFRRRQAAGGHARCISIFSGRIICANCGGYYGRKIWHAGSKYASWRWHCNNKFMKRKYCNTPTLKEESIEETFVAAINSIITRKSEIKANYELCLDAITDDSSLQAQLEGVNRECGEISTSINSLLTTSSKQKEGIKEINKRYEEYLARHEALQRKRKELSSQIGLLAAKRIQITAFLRELDKLDGPMKKFDPLVFQATVNYIKVNSDCTVIFIFRDGTELSRTIQNGVRKYAKRKKEIMTLLPKPLTKKSKRIAAYCRVSSQQDEQLHSLAAQVTYYENLLSRDDDYEFAGIYADTGISGTRTKNRVQFLQLIEDCRAGKVDGIITKSVSRFGRNTVDTLVFTRELRRYGIDVFFEKENLHSCSPEGELLLTLMAALAESEAVSMSDNIKWGKRRRFEKGLIGSLAINNIYGYCKRNGEIAINEQEATIVRRIFKEFVDGFNYNEITDGLLSDGITTRRPGASWAVTTIKNIISNEKYCGDCRFQKTFIQNPISHKRVPNRGELPQFLVEDCLPSIVDREIWSVAQEIRKRHTQESKPPCKEYPFRGMMFCGICGKSVNQQYTTREGRQLTATYRCISRVDCSGVEIPGLTYTPPHKSTYTKNPTDALVEYREKYCKKVPPRPLRCSDIRIPVERPQKAFVQAWNLIVSKKIRYQSTLQRTAITTDDVLMRHRANEMLSLVNTIGKIAEFDYSLMLRTLDRVETTSNDRLTFLFQSGIRITV